MKKKYITWAGIIAALVLVAMFVGICLSSFPFPYLSPAITMDPITDLSIDQNNMMILTGTSALPENADISIKVSASPGSLTPGNLTGRSEAKAYTMPLTGDGGRDRWRAVFDISDLQPADYTISLTPTTFIQENSTFVESGPITYAHFTLGDEHSGAGTIRKKNRVVQLFIRVNPPDQKTPAGTLRITGITSLAPGTLLAWSIQPVTDGTADGTPELQGTATVFTGNEGVNRWAVLPGNGTPGQGRYRFSIHADPEGTGSDAGVPPATSEFAIPLPPAALQNGTGAPGASPDFITIDALPDIRVNNVYMLTGTTSLPAGEDILVEVIPGSFETNYNFTVDAKESEGNRTLSGTAVFSGAGGMVTVVNGTGGENLWSFRLETYVFSPGEYQVTISKDYSGRTTQTPVPGNLSGSRMISIGSDSS
ncbi:MAG: hypothetical protein ABFC24_09200 [Methanoregulaceae archaeon]